MDKVTFSKVLKIAMKYYTYNIGLYKSDPFMCNCIGIALHKGEISSAEHTMASRMIYRLVSPHFRLHIYLEKNMKVGYFDLKSKDFMDFWKPHLIDSNQK